MDSNQTTQRQLPDGTQLRNGDYRTIRMIGHGGFGITYLAQHRIFGEVALKELFLNSGITYCSRESTTRQQVIPHFEPTQFVMFKKRFEEEARTLFNLRDIKGVVKVLDIFEENDTIYFSMEYLKGDKLEDYVKRRGRLTEDEGLNIVKMLGNTLNAIHERNVLHRDVKPTNVIVGSAGQVTLIDFGIARSYIDEIAETHTTFHSPRYAPPEQKIANAKLGAYSDVYALGATAYYLFTGIPPQSIEERSTEDFVPLRQLAPALPAYIDEAVTRSLAMKKEARFQTVKEFMAALKITPELPTPVPPPPPPIDDPAPKHSDQEATIIEPDGRDTEIYPPPSSKKETPDDGATIIEPPVKPRPRKSPLLWGIPILLALGACAYYLWKSTPTQIEPPPPQPPVVDITQTVSENPVPPPAPAPLIKLPASDTDNRLFDADKQRIERLLVGSWMSSDNKRLDINSTYTATFGKDPLTLFWHIYPMQGGIYLGLASEDDSKNWRLIISEEKTGTKSTLVLKLHDGPQAPFTAAENMAIYTRKR